GCSPISKAVKAGKDEIDPQKPHTIARSLAIGNPADGLYASRMIRSSGGWAEDVSDPEILDGIETLAASEGVFGETAAGVTVSCAFDCAAIALTRYLRVSATMESPDEGFAVTYHGPSPDSIPLDGRNVIVKAIKQYAARARRKLPGVCLQIENEIPLGVGLGS